MGNRAENSGAILRQVGVAEPYPTRRSTHQFPAKTTGVPTSQPQLNITAFSITTVALAMNRWFHVAALVRHKGARAARSALSRWPNAQCHGLDEWSSTSGCTARAGTQWLCTAGMSARMFYIWPSTPSATGDCRLFRRFCWPTSSSAIAAEVNDMFVRRAVAGVKCWAGNETTNPHPQPQ